jgi:hypothetical protein
MHRRLVLSLALALGLAALAAQAAEEPKKTEESDLPRVVVIQDETPLMFGQDKVGQVAEGTVVTLLETKAEWAKVRIPIGPTSWVETWLRLALTVPDSLQDVKVTVAAPKRTNTYENRVVAGMQFLEVKVKFEATDRSPSRLYFRWDDEAAADLYLAYGRDKRILPYGFLRQKPLSARRVFETVEKRQTLLLTQGAPLIETYVFAVPVRAREFDLVLKKKAETLREGRP